MLRHLFDGTKVREQLYSTRLVEFFQTHDAALQKELKTKLDSKEKTLGKILGKFLFKPLVGEYRLARQEYCEEEDSKTCYLGMGHRCSWHGWPDMVVGETPPAAGNTAIVLAWVVLNHRKFMLPFQTSRNSLDLKSHFPAVAGYDMHYFKGLFSYTQDAASVKRIPKVGGRTSMIDWYEPPEPKKRK